jgi:GNAT superfamily N-acetyltransferase/predicted nucleic acid-binding protein
MEEQSGGIAVKTNPDEVCAFLDEVRRAADSERVALGFLPRRAFIEAAAQGKLWIAVAQREGMPVYAGHIMFGGAFPILRIFQVFVSAPFRRRGVGGTLLRQLISEAESQNYLLVNAKVAGDLEANKFWNAQGFSVVRTIAGAGGRGREILLRERRLATPSLFDLLEATTAPTDHDLQLVDRLFARAPVYVLDVNVLLDLLKNRERARDVRRIISAAMAAAVSLYAAPELVEELRKSAVRSGDDPVLQFATTLPQYPLPAEAQRQRLFLELASMVFPAKLSQKRMKPRDESDLMHLVAAVHNKAAWFVTSERAILRCRKAVWERFGVDVVGVTELAQALSPAEWNRNYELKARRSTGTEICAVALQENERSAAEQFLTSAGVDDAVLRDALAPGYAGSPRRRFVIKVSEQILAYAAWDAPQVISSKVDAFVTAHGTDAAIESGLQCTLLSLMKDACQNGVSLVRILAVPGSTILRQAATSAGFRPIAGAERPNCEWFQKVCLGQVVIEDNWESARQQLLSRAKVELPAVIPRYAGPQTNVGVVSPQGAGLSLPLHELEELIGPALLLLRGRPGAIVPIRKNYAAQLLDSSLQSSLFPKYEASLLCRRAYLSAISALSATAPGTVLLFYESRHGKGQGAIVACARSVENAISPTHELPASIKARGVLEDKAIEIVGATGRTGVTLFDSIFKFSKPVPLQRLRKIGCVDGTNLVTSRKLSYERLQSILREGVPHV